jgi:hemerythrin superfamily protein
MATSANRSTAKTQIVDMLKADHQKVKKAFNDFGKLDPETQAAQAEALVAQTLIDIEMHATLEEEIFYPRAREAIIEDDLIDEAEVEHMTAKVLIEQLKGMSAGDEKFAASFKVLGEYIDHHVKEEESEMFKRLTGADVDWDQTLAEMQDRRAELLEAMGVQDEKSDASSARTKAARRPSQRAESRPQASSRPSKSRSEKH